MSKRGVGLLLILTAAIALGALVQDYRFDHLIATEQAAVSALDQRARDLDRHVDGAAAGGEDSIKSIAANRDRSTKNISQIQMLRLAMNGVALIFTLAVAVYLGRVATVLGVTTPASMAQMLRDLPPPVKNGVANGTTNGNGHGHGIANGNGTGPTPIAPPAPVAPSLVAAPTPVHSSTSTYRPSANLAAAADLCVDLAKVLDADDMPVLLVRAALVLDARGIVLWGVDSDGVRLQPSLGYGYSDKVLAKLRPLQMDADNVTSLAFRSSQPQMMTGASTTDPAALAIPLLTGGGCVGVMAVELRHNRPHADLLPVARILSAQFSTLVAPAEDTLQRVAK
jgi:hypothetical protein